MIFQIFQNGLSLRQNLVLTAIMLITVFVSMTLHEFAHGYVSYLQGDDTAKKSGRLTLNTLKHIDFVGFMCMLFCGFGWAKPVPINARHFKNPKWGMALTGIAGPIANLIMGIVGSILYGFTLPLWARLSAQEGFVGNIANVMPLFFFLLGMYNFIFMAFNLIPLPPFDGSRFFYAFLPAKVYFGIMKYERFILLGLFAVLFVLTRFFGISPFSWIAEKIFYGVANPFFLLGKLLFL